MARLDNLPIEILEMIWENVADDTTVVVTHKKFPGTSIKIPSICGPTSEQAYSRESALIIEAVLLKLAVKDRVYIRVNILNFDFTNFIRFIKYHMAIPGERTTPRGDITSLGLVDNTITGIECRHKVTDDLERNPAKLATWIKFANTLYKNTRVRLGVNHVLMSVVDTPALRDLSDSQTETEIGDGSQAFLVALGIYNWRREAQWKIQYGSIAEGRHRWGLE